MSVPSLKKFWKPVAVAALLVFVYAHVLRKLGYDYWTDENYSHGLLVPFIIGFILWIERDRLSEARKRPALWFGLAGVVAALFTLWAGTAGAELFIQRVSLALMLASIVVYFWGFRVLRLTLVPFALLLLAIPIPVIIFNKIAFPLQLFASRCAVWSMRLLEIPVLRDGNIIELMPKRASEPKRLEVVQACSGIRSLMTLVTLAVVFAYFTHLKNDKGNASGGGGALSALKSFSFWRSVIIVLSALPIAILTNAARVSGTGILAHHYGTEVADSFFHSFSGWVIYLVALMLLFAVGWLVEMIGKFISRGGDGDGGGSAVATAQEAKSYKSDASIKSAAPVAVNAVTAKGASEL